MIKKISTLLVMLVSSLSTTVAQQPETKQVEFYNTTETTKIVSLGAASLEFRLTNTSDGKKLITVYFNNKDNENSFLMFNGTHYDKKTLRKTHRIKCDQNYLDSRSHQEIDGCNRLKSTQPIIINPGQNIPIIEITDAEIQSKLPNIISLDLPIYYVHHKYRWSKKWSIYNERRVIVKLDIDLKFDKTYNDLSQRYQELQNEYDSTIFCTNAAHKPSLEDQKEEFQDKINALIEDIKYAEGEYNSECNQSKRFSDLFSIEKLDLDAKEGVCDSHNVAVKTTKRPNPKPVAQAQVSLKMIARELEDIYNTLYCSPNREEVKEHYIKDAYRLYENAKKHKDWDNSTEHKKIEEAYRRIIKL